MTKRPEYFGIYPVKKDNFEINTPDITTLRIVLGMWMDAGSPGGIVSGYSRTGKTRAIRNLMNKKLPLSDGLKMTGNPVLKESS